MSIQKRLDVETRVVAPAGELQLRAEPVDGADGRRRIVGYAAVYEELSEDLGGFREKIAPGAFARTLKAGADVRALVDHDPSKILGRNRAGTLEITTNGKGLLVKIDPPDTQAARDLLVSLERGDVTGMSFAFTVPSGGDAWELLPNGSGAIRTLRDIDLHDVSVVTYPAYPQTEVGLRSLKAFERELSKTASLPADELRRMRMRLDLAERA